MKNGVLTILLISVVFMVGCTTFEEERNLLNIHKNFYNCTNCSLWNFSSNYTTTYNFTINLTNNQTFNITNNITSNFTTEYNITNNLSMSFNVTNGSESFIVTNGSILNFTAGANMQIDQYGGSFIFKSTATGGSTYWADILLKPTLFSTSWANITDIPAINNTNGSNSTQCGAGQYLYNVSIAVNGKVSLTSLCRTDANDTGRVNLINASLIELNRTKQNYTDFNAGNCTIAVKTKGNITYHVNMSCLNFTSYDFWNRTGTTLTQKYFGEPINTTGDIIPYADETLKLGNYNYRFNQSYIEQRSTGILLDNDNDKIILNSTRQYNTSGKFVDIVDTTYYDSKITSRNDTFIHREVYNGQYNFGNAEIYDFIFRTNQLASTITIPRSHVITRHIINETVPTMVKERSYVHLSGVDYDAYNGEINITPAPLAGVGIDSWILNFDMPLPDENFTISTMPRYTLVSCIEGNYYVMTTCIYQHGTKNTLRLMGSANYQVWNLFANIYMGSFLNSRDMYGALGCRGDEAGWDAVHQCDYQIRLAAHQRMVYP